LEQAVEVVVELPLERVELVQAKIAVGAVGAEVPECK
jgi:hypothetical protein